VSEADGERRDEARAAGIPAAAALLAGSVLLSRVLGFARESLLAYQVGTSGQADAYYAAFQIPDLFNHLLAGGALSIAFLPLYTRVRTEQGEAAAERLLATVLGTLGAIALGATILLWLLAEPLVALQFPRFDAAKQSLTVHLTRIVLPAQIGFVAGGIVQVPLLALERFLAAALAPLLYNLGIIAGGVLPRGWASRVSRRARGALADRCWCRGSMRAVACASGSLRAVRSDLPPLPVVAAPLMFGQTLLTVDEWYGRWFGGWSGRA
jgi:putative peptidoglycan lipid II flippase